MGELLAWFAGDRGFVRVRVDARVESAQRHRTWRVSRNGYVYAAAGRSAAVEFLHRLVIGAPARVPVDHRNGDIFDARRRNLRLCTNALNGRNRVHLARNNSSGVTGVLWSKGAWVAQLTVAGRYVYLGRHRSAAHAVAARRAGELQHFGAYAPDRT